MASKPQHQIQTAGEVQSIKPASAPTAIRTLPNGTTETVHLQHRMPQPSSGEQPLYLCKTSAGIYAYLPENQLTTTGAIINY